jgi:hypothetical protein
MALKPCATDTDLQFMVRAAPARDLRATTQLIRLLTFAPSMQVSKKATCGLGAQHAAARLDTA